MTGQVIRCFLVVLALLDAFSTKAQQPVVPSADSLAIRLKYYARQKGTSLLFAHFDKTIYGNNEHVWFTTYLLGEQDRDPDSVVSVILVNDLTHSILLKDQFLITDGVSPGHMLLPDSIPTGDYSFILYTEKIVNGLPRNFFVQRVHIRNTNAIPKAANIALTVRPSAAPPARGRPNVLVKFYPEGGSLSEGLENAVGWEAKTPSGIPLQVTGIVYKDGLAVDTVRTSPYGMGVFKLRPEATSHYEFRLAGSKKNLSADTTAVFELPSMVTDRPIVFTPAALANDTLNLTIRNKRTASFFLVIHNYEDLFFLLPIQAGPEGKVFKIALTDLPKGIAAVTVLDSLQRPCAERLFFAHYDRRNNVSILTDRLSYKTGDSASLTISLRSPDDRPVSGMVSVAIVQASRLVLRKKNNIESWLYLNHELGSLPFKEDYLGYNSSNPGKSPRDEDKDYLEDILRIKGWRNYSWAEVARVSLSDTLIHYESLRFTGSVTRSGRPIKKPVSLVLMKGWEVNIINTDETGAFHMSYADLFTADNKKIYLLVDGDNRGLYRIVLNDAFEPVSRTVSDLSEPINTGDQPGEDSLAGSENLKGWKKVGNLKEVVITGRNNSSFYASRKSVNACGDYVCRYGFLDCPYHAGEVYNTAPVTGKSYKVFDGTSADGTEIFHTVVYQECIAKKPETGGVALNGIHYSMSFYRDDMLTNDTLAGDSHRDDRSNDDFISTLYWKHLYKIFRDGTMPIRFRIGAITGQFKIIVQGVGENDVFYGEGSFPVR